MGRRALAASLVLAASVVIGVGLGPTTFESPAPQTPPGGVPTATPPPAPSVVPPDMVERITTALSAADIRLVSVDSILGEESATQLYRVSGSDDLPIMSLPREPLEALQVAGIAALRDLRAGSGWMGAERLGVEQVDGQDALRVRTTSSMPHLGGGEVTRIEYLIDTSTWLPRMQETWATSDDGEEHVLVSRLTWLDSDRRSVQGPDSSVTTGQ